MENNFIICNTSNKDSQVIAAAPAILNNEKNCNKSDDKELNKDLMLHEGSTYENVAVNEDGGNVELVEDINQDQLNESLHITSVETAKDNKELILVNGIEYAIYQIPLQIISNSDEVLEIDKKGTVVERSVPMKTLNELVSHKGVL